MSIENKKYKPDSLKFVINRSIILEQLIVWAAFCTPNFKACIASNENTKKIGCGICYTTCPDGVFHVLG